MINEDFKKWASGFSGCDGGNIGSSKDKSIWLCGIEWGEGFTKDEIADIFKCDVSQPPIGYEDWRKNIAWIYNWQAMKILSVVNGFDIKNYKKFAEEVRPFVNNSESKYFKMNLYPIAFKNTSHEYWKEHYVEKTNLQTKQEYIDWIKNNRFPIMSNWVKEYAPKLILCVGITYFDDFKKAFMISEVNIYEEIIDDKQLKYFVNDNGTLVVNIPFMVNRNGLIKNVSIEKFGKRINQLINE